MKRFVLLRLCLSSLALLKEIVQNRYTGDVGDYIKLALLRFLQPGRSLGVAWWLYPDEAHNTDGRHVSYLKKPDEWRVLDPKLFDGLCQIVASGVRRVSALQDACFLPDAVFCDSVIPDGVNSAERRSARDNWLNATESKLSGCDLVFLDPDNGLETSRYTLGAKMAGKSVSLDQLKYLTKPGRTLVIYHHQTRRKGGHFQELEYWAERLRHEGFQTVDAIRSRPYSPRAFFLLNASPDLRSRAEHFSNQAKDGCRGILTAGFERLEPTSRRGSRHRVPG